MLRTKRMLQTVSGWFGGLAVALMVASCSTTGPEAKSVSLFNGTDLSGWQYVSADPQVALDKVWSVEKGLLTCKGTPVGAIYQGPEVTNFRLWVEYRWAPGTQPGNSGIFSRITDPTKSIPGAIEVQLMNGNAGDVLGLQGVKIAPQARFFAIEAHKLAGDIAGVKKLEALEKPPGEWNRVEILAQGSRYTVRINGRLANEVDGVQVLAGPVGLQSEGGTIQFRTVRLTPLD